MKLPDRIIAIGGAGKALAYELLEADWVLDSILQPRPKPRSLTVTFIDTAEEERNRDLERIQEIRATVQEKKKELREGSRDRPGDIDVEYLPLTDNIQLHDRNDLIGDSVDRIASGNGMDPDDWWLEAEHIDETLNFATGVVRKRGLGKAIYYKAYAEDDTVSTNIDLPNKGTVAVFAGLGGGTGSGVVLDLVKDLKQTKRTAEITLFGILPNDKEPDQENANAHAALSEMEYMSLTGEDVFKDRILIPIDPTGYGGKREDGLNNEPLVEFDRAAIYLIVAYYNMMDMEDPFENIPSYAPFILGIPQVLRYNVDAIKDAKGSLQEMLSDKQDALEAEEEAYSDVDRFLSKQYNVDTDDVDFNDAAISNLEERLNSVKSLLEFDLFNELDYHSVSTFKEIINDAERESDDIVKQIEIIEGTIIAGTTGGDDGQFVDSTDQQLSTILKEDLTQLAFRKQVLARIQAIDDNRVRGALGFLIGQDDDVVNPGVRLNRLDSKADEARDRVRQLETDLEEAEAELEETREQQSEELRRRIDDWESRARREYEEYEDVRDIDVRGLAADLEQELENYATQVDQCSEPDDVEVVSGTEVRDALDRLENQLSSLDVDISDRRSDVVDAIDNLAEAKKSFLTMNQDDDGLLSGIFGSDDERERAEKNFTAKRNRLSNSGVFVVSNRGQNLGIEVEFDTTQLVEQAEADVERVRNRTVETFREELSEPDQRAIDKFERELEQGAGFRQLRSIAEEAFEAELAGTSEVATRKENLEAELAEVREQVELYEATVDLFKEVNKRRERFVNQQGNDLDRQSLKRETDGQSISTADDDYLYVKPTRPEEILKLQGDDDIAESHLFDETTEAGQRERTRLRGHLEELAERSYDPKYNGLQKRRLSGDRSRYQHTTLAFGLVSRAVDQIRGLASGLENNVFSGAYNTATADGGGVASFGVEAGGSWDVGLPMFVGGVFLDNLRKESAASGYPEGYNGIEQSDDTDIRIHHTLGLDKGFYVRRQSVMNMEDRRDVRFFLQEDTEIRDQLLEEYLEKVRIDGVDGDDEAGSGGEAASEFQEEYDE